MLGFRVIRVAMPSLPGIRAQAEVAIGWESFVIFCEPGDIDPPGYEKLRRLAAEKRIQDLNTDIDKWKADIQRAKTIINELEGWLGTPEKHKKRAK